MAERVGEGGSQLTAGRHLLALATATRTSSVALMRDGLLLGDRASVSGRHHAEQLLPLVDEVLVAAGVPLEAIDDFAVAVGPGSFTSLRVGVATVKGLAFRGHANVAAVSSLAALAWLAPATDDARPILALLDAQRGEAYAGLFERDGDVLRERVDALSESVHTVEELAARLPPRTRVVLVSEGVDAYASDLVERIHESVEIERVDGVALHARAVAALGTQLLAGGEAIDASALVPRYVRRAEAEVLRTRRRFEAPEGARDGSARHFDSPKNLD